MKKALNQWVIAGSVVLLSTAAWAKLPALSEEVKAKAAETAAKAAWNGKVDAYLSCKAQDRVAAHYIKTATSNNKEVKPAATMPPCADPGAFSFVPVVATKPIEAAGAHSPAGTATSPPSSVTPAASITPAKKP